MYRVCVLAVVLMVGLANPNELRKKCFKLGHPDSLRCCKSGKPNPDISPDVVKECIDTPRVPHSCEPDLCIAKKRGYASGDGTINREAFEEIVTKDFKDSPILTEVIKDKCIRGDVEKCGAPNICEIAKIHHCINEQHFMECTTWDNSGITSCEELKNLVKECSAL